MSFMGRTIEVYSRVTGFFRPVDNWNEGKKEEYNDRKTYNASKDEEVVRDKVNS